MELNTLGHFLKIIYRLSPQWSEYFHTCVQVCQPGDAQDYGCSTSLYVPASRPAVSVRERQLVSCPASRRLGSCGLHPGVQIVAAESAIMAEQGGGCGQ